MNFFSLLETLQGEFSNLHPQCAKKVLSDSLGLEDFAIGLVSFVLAQWASKVFLQFK